MTYIGWSNSQCMSNTRHYFLYLFTSREKSDQLHDVTPQVLLVIQLHAGCIRHIQKNGSLWRNNRTVLQLSPVWFFSRLYMGTAVAGCYQYLCMHACVCIQISGVWWHTPQCVVIKWIKKLDRWLSTSRGGDVGWPWSMALWKGLTRLYPLLLGVFGHSGPYGMG